MPSISISQSISQSLSLKRYSKALALLDWDWHRQEKARLRRASGADEEDDDDNGDDLRSPLLRLPSLPSGADEGLDGSEALEADLSGLSTDELVRLLILGRSPPPQGENGAVNNDDVQQLGENELAEAAGLVLRSRSARRAGRAELVRVLNKLRTGEVTISLVDHFVPPPLPHLPPTFLPPMVRK